MAGVVARLDARALHAVATGVVGLALLAPPNAQAQGTVRLPDLSSYDCSAISAANTAEIRHMGQVVKGRYHEWHEIYVNVAGKARLGCIAMTAPRAQQMTASEAQSFLTDSAAIGAPNGDSTAPAAMPDLPEPDNVKPEPPKHRSRTPAMGGAEQKQGTTQELPPVPAEKRAPEAADQQGLVSPPVRRSQDYPVAPVATVGVEDRAAVTGTTAFPYNTVGYLSVTYPTGESFRCSATLVSPYVVLTAGHCIHNGNRGGYVTQVRFYPGQSQNTLGDGTAQRPYGGKSDFAALQTTQVWTEISGKDAYPVDQYGSDMAAIEFKTPFTFTTTFMPILYGNTAGPVTNDGYPATVRNQDAYGQWTDTGAENSSTSLRSYHVREFAIDASGGDSGSPFFFVDTVTGRSSLVGSLSYGQDLDDQAGGPWYDTWNQALLSSWVSWTPATATSGLISGLHVANVFSSAQQTSQSYLRFYNSGSSAGSVAVTLADPDSGTALATWTSPNVPGGSELQFYIKDIEQSADKSFTRPAFYSISVRPTFSGYLQHVLWQQVDNSITNLTNCDTAAVTDPKVLMGVHSSLLAAGYPSTVVIYNAGTAAVNIALGIYDARNGARLATYSTGSLQPNAEKLVTAAQIEAAASPRITPSGNLYHYVLKADTSFTGYIQHVVTNTSDAVVTDMTSVCRLSP